VWLGIEGDDAPDGTGVQVEDVTEGSPAADAGLQPDDRIVAVDGAAVATMSDLVALLREHDPGDDVQLTYVRTDAEATTEVTLAERA
jgi:S1-C subfamily serine protease